MEFAEQTYGREVLTAKDSVLASMADLLLEMHSRLELTHLSRLLICNCAIQGHHIAM